MKVKHLMTSPAVTTSPATPVKDAITLLANRGISALPVVEAEGHLLGIVSESDLIQVLSVAGSEAQSGVVGDLMTADVISVDEETGLPEVARRLLDSKVRRVPVLKEERVAGIVSRRDLIKWMARSDAVLATDVCGVLRDEGQRLSQLEVAREDLGPPVHVDGDAAQTMQPEKVETLLLGYRLQAGWPVIGAHGRSSNHVLGRSRGPSHGRRTKKALRRVSPERRP
jgi:CBS domain-containing protein